MEFVRVNMWLFVLASVGACGRGLFELGSIL
jgi:hypothetical protein